MKFDTEGTYTLTYTATDSCGNSTSEERTVVVASPRTVLYTDGTFIINEQPEDRVANVAAHGEATNTYIPFDPNGATDDERYEFAGLTRVLWQAKVGSIKSFIIGSPIEPTRTSYWYYGINCNDLDFTNLLPTNFTDASYMFYGYSGEKIDVSTLDTRNVTNMESMFAGTMNLTSLDLSMLDTRNVTNMESMFAVGQNGSPLNTLDLSSFDTRNVTNMVNMFMHRNNLQTIYASADFVTTQVANSTNMFRFCNVLKGGANTAYSSSHIDKEYARIDNPPDAPGYFTLKE